MRPSANRSRWLSLGAALALWAWQQPAEAQVFRQDPHVRLYTKQQLDAVPCVHRTLLNLPLNIDASLTFLKQGSLDQVRVIWTSPFGLDLYSNGSISGKSFFASREYEAEHDNTSALPSEWLPTTTEHWTLNKNYTGPATADVDGFIQNVYKVGPNELLGFIHVERSNVNMAQLPIPDRLYAIGIAYSSDLGKSWRYAGDVIRPNYDQLGDRFGASSEPYMSNIGGIPYTVVNDGGVDYFYVYFNEYVPPTGGGNPISRPFSAVARAPVSQVIADAQAGTVRTVWRKYNPGPSGSWTQDGLAGRGTGVLPFTLDDINAGFYDMHTRAAYSVPLRKHLLLANRVEWIGDQLWRKLVLFTSSDGLSWTQKAVVDGAFGDASTGFVPPYGVVYASFVSTASGTSDDFNRVGRDFTVIYPRQYELDYTDSDLYSRKLTAFQDISPSYAAILY